TSQIYTLSLHDALPISDPRPRPGQADRPGSHLPHRPREHEAAPTAGTGQDDERCARGAIVRSQWLAPRHSPAAPGAAPASSGRSRTAETGANKCATAGPAARAVDPGGT